MMRKFPGLNLKVIKYLKGRNYGVGSAFDEPFSRFHQHGDDEEDSEEIDEGTGEESNHDEDDDEDNMELCPSQGN
jgi:hypothetical protein